MTISAQSGISSLFTALPAELRLQIYEQLFEGSTVSYKKKHTAGGGRAHHSILLPSGHCNFLLACNQAYGEAIKIYWSRITLYGDPEDKELTFFLGNIVPDLAKPYIRHIRGLNSRELPYRPLDRCLKDYRRLQTIAFEGEWSINVAALGDRGASPTMEDWAAEYCMTQLRWKFAKLLCDGGPAVVFRGVYSLDVGDYSPEMLEEKFPDMIKGLQKQRKVSLFVHHATSGSPWFRGLEGANSLISHRSASITAAQTMASSPMVPQLRMTERRVLQSSLRTARRRRKICQKGFEDHTVDHHR